jgi:uncharacterized protein YkwD
MRSHRSNLALILVALFAMLLVPTSSALALDDGALLRLERVSRRAHSEHARLIDKVLRHRERLMAEAQAIRERTMAEARAVARRVRVQSRAARRRLIAQSRAAQRRIARMPRTTRVRETRRSAPTRDSVAFSFEGSISGLDASSEFSVALNIEGGGHPCDHDVDLFEEEEEARIVVPYIEEAIEDALAEVPIEEAVIEELELLEEPEVLELELLEEPEVLELELLEEPEVLELELVEEPEVVIEAPPAVDTSAVNGDFGRVEWEILARINAIRAERGLSELTYDPRLQAGAVNHSAEMYRMNYFSHTSPVSDHAEFDMRIQREGIGDFQSAGENLVMGPDSAQLAERFVDLWMDSPGHRDNILGDDFRFSGVGVYGQGDRVYATQLFSQRVDRSFE